MQLRFEVLPSRLVPRSVERGFSWLVLPAVFVPGIWILVGFIAGRDVTAGIVIGGWFLAVAGGIAWTIWGSAYEVVVDGEEVRWRGLVATGRAPLSDLRWVKGRGWTFGRPVEFVFTRLRGFSIMPANGLVEFIDRLRAVAPHVRVELSAGARRSTRWRRGVFEETN